MLRTASLITRPPCPARRPRDARRRRRGRPRPRGGSRRTSSGVPVAITSPNSSTMMHVADAEHEAHVVVDEQHRGAAGRRPGAAGGRGCSLSVVSRPAAGSSRQTTRGAAASARATPTSLRSPCESSSGSLSATASRPTRSAHRAPRPRPTASATGSRAACPAPTAIPRRRRGSRPRSGRRRARWPATCAPGRCARAHAAAAARGRGRASSTRPRERTKPVMASMNVVLPAPLGPISPTRSPRDLELDVDERVHAAEAHRHAAGP